MRIEPDPYPRVERGRRALLVGRTGSGKSNLAVWLLSRSPGAWLILNPKYSKAFDRMANAIRLNTLDLNKIDEAFKKSRFVIINPPAELNIPEILDFFIERLRRTYDNLGLYIDELLLVHINGNPGDGLVNWLTLGRESNLSFIGATQRPRRVSLFVFSESDYFGIMRLNLFDDRKRVYEFVGDKRVLENPELHYWYWYETNAELLRYFQPVPLAPES